PERRTLVGATAGNLCPRARFLVFRDQAPETMAEDLRRDVDADPRDPEAHARLREACRRHVEAHYTWDRTIDALEEELTRLVTPPLASAARPAVCPADRKSTRLNS